MNKQQQKTVVIAGSVVVALVILLLLALSGKQFVGQAISIQAPSVTEGDPITLNLEANVETVAANFTVTIGDPSIFADCENVIKPEIENKIDAAFDLPEDPLLPEDLLANQKLHQFCFLF